MVCIFGCCKCWSYPLAVIGVLTSVIGAFYYLRIIRLMYFQDPDAPLDEGLAHQNRMILVVSIGFILLFFFGIGALSEQATSIVSVYLIALKATLDDNGRP